MAAARSAEHWPVGSSYGAPLPPTGRGPATLIEFDVNGQKLDERPVYPKTSVGIELVDSTQGEPGFLHSAGESDGAFTPGSDGLTLVDVSTDRWR